MTNPYQALGEYDPFGVAHALKMPASLFEAFKKIMCAGSRGYKVATKDYEEAIYSLQRFYNDVSSGKITHCRLQKDQVFLFNKIKNTYRLYLQQQMNLSETEQDAQRLKNAYYAGTIILDMYNPNGRRSLYLLTNDAIDNLNAALSYSRVAVEYQQ